MTVVETQRLTLRRLTLADAAFTLALLNEPSFLRYIGDKGVRTLDDARAYLLGLIDHYEQFGFGLYLVERKANRVPIGICGLIKRDTLEDVDIGFAFLPAYWMQGYAYESAAAVIAHAQRALGLTRIVAVVQPDNLASIKTLEKLGLAFEKMVRLSENGPEVQLFALSG